MNRALVRNTRRAFLLVLFSPLLLGVVVFLELGAYQQSVDWVAHTREVLGHVDHLMVDVGSADSASRAFFLTGDTGHLDVYDRARLDSHQELARVQAMTVDNSSQQKILGELQVLLDRHFAATGKLHGERMKRAISAAEYSAFFGLNSTSTHQLWNHVEAINREENRLLKSRNHTEDATELGVGASFVVCILVNLGILVWAYRLITEYGRAREAASHQILRLNADLEQRVAQRTSELQTANEQLLRSNDDLTKFAYIASHDLQEPLRTIGSYVGLLSHRYHGKLDEQADKYIRFVVEGAKRMQNLVQDLLLYSRVGTEGLRLSPVNVEDVLNHVRDSLQLVLRENNVALVVGHLPTLKADETRLTQVFTNLVANAIKFRNPDQAPSIEISASRHGSDWLFTVRDNGIGFEQQYGERIFAIFQRLHGVGVYPGTGMGLAICRRVVELHGGRIWATSDGKSGSVFSFTLPANLSVNMPERERSSGDKMKADEVRK